jgi:hypothetical protein
LLGYPAGEETYGNATRLVPTQLRRSRFQQQLKAGVRRSILRLYSRYIGKYLSRLRKLDDVITPKEGFET